MPDTPDILKKIADANRESLTARKAAVPETELLCRAAARRPAKPLYDALKHGTGTRIIAELKKASPSKGLIRPDFQFERFAREYIDAGAAAISVLTEEHFFKGSLAYLEKVAELAAGTTVPVLRKDFLFDRYQIVEARAAGADAVLLIAALVTDDENFSELLELARSLGMEPLCEAHTAEEVARLVRLGARIIGVNSRDLHTFHTDVSRTRELLELVPSGCASVAESGIASAGDIKSLAADAFLVGETLMRCERPGEKLRELRGEKPCAH